MFKLKNTLVPLTDEEILFLQTKLHDRNLNYSLTLCQVEDAWRHYGWINGDFLLSREIVSLKAIEQLEKEYTALNFFGLANAHYDYFLFKTNKGFLVKEDREEGIEIIFANLKDASNIIQALVNEL